MPWSSRPKKMIPTRATPRAFATCCSVDDVADTVPACWGWTEPITTPTSPDSVTPMPDPADREAGHQPEHRRRRRRSRSTASSSSAWPAPKASAAAAIPARAPKRPSTRAGVAGADHVGHRHRGEDGAGRQRAEAAAVLEVERQHQEVRRHAGEQQELRQLPGADRPGRASARRRRAARSPRRRSAAPAQAGQPGEDGGAAEGQPRSTAASPGCCPWISGSTSAVSAADDEHATRRRPAAGRRPGCRAAAAARADEGGDADRHVDQEDRPPAGAGDVEVDQQAADQLAGGGGDAHDGGVGAERADPVRAGVHVADQGEHGRRRPRPPRRPAPAGRRAACRRRARSRRRPSCSTNSADAERRTSAGGPSGRPAGWPRAAGRRR